MLPWWTTLPVPSITPLTVMLWLASRRVVPVTVRLEGMAVATLVTLSVEPSFRLYFQPEGMTGLP